MFWSTPKENEKRRVDDLRQLKSQRSSVSLLDFEERRTGQFFAAIQEQRLELNEAAQRLESACEEAKIIEFRNSPGKDEGALEHPKERKHGPGSTTIIKL